MERLRWDLVWLGVVGEKMGLAVLFAAYGSSTLIQGTIPIL